MGPEQPRRTLADIIMEKIREKEMEMAGEGKPLPSIILIIYTYIHVRRESSSLTHSLFLCY